MRICHIPVCVLLALVACGDAEQAEIYNENNTNVINGLVYNTNEKPINGLYRTYYSNGNLKMEISSRGGLPNGIGKFYNEDGGLAYQGIFKDGKLDGMLYQYYPEGSVHNEMNYNQDILDGVQKIYDSEGNQTAEIIYDKGKPVSGFVIMNENKTEFTPEELENLREDSEVEATPEEAEAK